MTRRGFTERLTDWVIDHRVSVIIVLGLVAVASTVIALHIKFDFTPQALFSGNGALTTDAEEFSRRFGFDDSIVLIALEAVGTDDVLAPAALNWQAEVARRLNRDPDVLSVESIPTLEVLELRGGLLRGTLQPVPLVEALPVDDATADAVRERLAGIPSIDGALLSVDRRLAALAASLDSRDSEVEHVRLQVATIQKMVDEVELPAGYRIHYSGLPVIRSETIDNLHRDQRTMLPLAGVIYFMALGVMFRRVSGTVLPLLAVGVGLAVTFAILTLAGQTLNVVSNVLPVLLLIIGISSCVQIVAAYSEESHLTPTDRLSAVRRALAHTVKASLVATVTTLIGFASLVTARSVALKQFGLHSVLGIGCLFVCVVLVLGALFPYFRPPKPALASRYLVRALLRAAEGIGHAVAVHPWPSLLGSVLVIGAALWVGRTVVIDHYVLETYPESHPTAQTLRLIERQLSGIMPLEISLTADRPGRFLERDVYQKVQKLAEESPTLPGVLLARSYVDLHQPILDRLNRAAGTDDVGDELWTNRMLRGDRLLRKHAEAFHYSRFLSSDGQHARIMLRTSDIGSRKMMETIRRLRGLLDEAFPPGSPITATLTGDAYVDTIAMENLIRDLYSSLLTASLAIFGMIALQFRSLRVGLISALPNLTPLALTLGYMGLRGYHLNVSNVVVFTISLGFADDTTIHFLFRFRELLRTGLTAEEAIDQTFDTTGRAILQTSALIMAGLSVLLFSEFIPTKRFGELTMVTLAGNLLGVLMILPACLTLFWKREAVAPAAHP